jgi:heme A synthase
MAGAKPFSVYAWFVLAFSIAVILWGGGVRATRSGAGCGDQWPLCNGHLAPRSPQIKTIIEFTHRVTSGPTLAVFVAGLLLFAFRGFPRGHLVRRFAALSVVLTVTEALLGAALVLLGHVDANTSPARAYSLTLHLMNTMFLLAALTLTAWFATRPRASDRQAYAAGVSRSALMLGVVAFLLIGVSGAIAALGVTLFPSASLAAGLQEDFSAGAHIFVRLRILHPILALTLGIIVGGLGIPALRSREASATAKRLAWGLIALTTVQAGLGALNLILMAPVWMQLVHLFVADLLWIVLVLFCAEAIGARREGDRLGTRAAEARESVSGLA